MLTINIGLVPPESVVKLQFLPRAGGRWILLPKQGALQEQSQNEVPWVLAYHIFKIC